MAGPSKTFRLGTQGAEQVSRDFARVGGAGEKMGRDITKGAAGVSPAMRGLDTAVAQAGKGVQGFAGKAGALGGVLTSMGPLGLAAAAGIGAVGLAFAEAAKRGEAAIGWAESLDLLAQRLDTSARSVQEWRFAASQFGVDASKTDAALEKLNNTIGLASRDIPKAVKLFKALGFDDAQIKGFRDVDTVLPQVAEKLAALAPAARAGLANKLGLSELLPVLAQGEQGVADLKKQFDELGLIIDDGALRRAAEDNDRLDLATARAEASTQRFNLALTGTASAWAEFKANSAEAFEDIFSNFQELEERATRVLRNNLADVRAKLAATAGPNVNITKAQRDALRMQEVQLESQLLSREPQGRAVFRRQALAGLGGGASALDDEEPSGDKTKAAGKDPVLAALEAKIKAMREAQSAAMGLAAVEAQNPGLAEDEVKARFELLEAYRLIDEARAAGVLATDAEAQGLKDYQKANQDAAAAVTARADAEKIAEQRASRAASAAQYFETPLQRMRREQAELRDLGSDGSLDPETMQRGLRELNDEYRELAASQFEASTAGQLLGGVLKGQIRSVGDFKAALLSLVQERLIENLFGQLGKLGDGLGQSRGGGGGGLGGLISAGASFLFGGGRATGGPVQAGMIYKVNENTPRSEYFRPGVSGEILTAAQVDGMMAERGGGSSFSFSAPLTIDARGADASVLPGIQAQLEEHKRFIEAKTRTFAKDVRAVVSDASRRRVFS